MDDQRQLEPEEPAVSGQDAAEPAVVPKLGRAPLEPADGEAGPPIRATDRVFLVSSTRSGKSTVAAHLFSQFRCQRVLVDPKAEWRLRGVKTQRTPDDLDVALEYSALAHFVPGRLDRSELDRLYEVLFTDRRDVMIWTDETAAVCLDGWAPRCLRLLQTQGAAMRIGHLYCSTRPRRIPREMLTEADHILVFEKGLAADDLQDVAREMELSLDELRALLADLPRFGFVWFQRRSKTIHTADALPPDLVSASSRVAYKVL